MTMGLLAKKMSIIAALLALMVVLLTGFISGGAVDVIMMRGGLIFFMIMGIGMLLFNLALKDRLDTSEINAEADEDGHE